MTQITILTMTGGMAVACLTVSSLGVEPKDSSQFSDVLPDVLAEFVVRAGTDRGVDGEVPAAPLAPRHADVCDPALATSRGRYVV